MAELYVKTATKQACPERPIGGMFRCNKCDELMTYVGQLPRFGMRDEIAVYRCADCPNVFVRLV
jgi:hypothetical protein